MRKTVSMVLLLAFACGKADQPPARDTSEPSAPTPAVIAAKPSPEANKTRSQDQLQCATLVAAYQAERNRQFGGDRATLRERLTKVGEQFKAQAKEIPGCDFPVP
jgi:hypothetical protein